MLNQNGEKHLFCNRHRDGASATILLIDDDEASCFLLSKALTARGWKVVPATTLHEAEAAICRLGPERVGLVITDVHLSHDLGAFEGLELYTRWTAIYPTLPFLLMSSDPRCKTFTAVCNGSVGFLYKPFALRHLLETVGMHLRPQSEATARA